MLKDMYDDLRRISSNAVGSSEGASSGAPHGHRWRRAILRGLGLCLLILVALPAAASDAPTSSPLRQFSDSIAALVKRVSPAVVQVLVTGYAPVEGSRENATDLVVGRQRSLASGVIIDASGYIVTNAHVVAGAKRIEVVLPGSTADVSPIRSLGGARGRALEARVAGVARELDLALLQVDATGLPALPTANYDALRQGDLVFAFGSPEGLRNSVTMGVVSAVARQPDADHPMVYIQTDAPINHGNSGGPLVNANGELVGINTFILSESGGSEGLGFAIPSTIVSVACEQLRRYGHLHRAEIGANLQTLTPDLARGLGLTQDWGVLVSDLFPGGPADLAGLEAKDIIVSIDDKPIDSLPMIAFYLYTRNAGDRLRVAVLRGEQQVTRDVFVVERPEALDRVADLLDPDKSLVPQLGILGVSIDEELRSVIGSLRLPSGVLVAARAEDSRGPAVALSPGDVVHSVNGVAISNLEELRATLDGLKPKSSVALQIEREGRLTFVAFALD
jgi:serine protease Do